MIWSQKFLSQRNEHLCKVKSCNLSSKVGEVAECAPLKNGNANETSSYGSRPILTQTPPTAVSQPSYMARVVLYIVQLTAMYVWEPQRRRRSVASSGRGGGSLYGEMAASLTETDKWCWLLDYFVLAKSAAHFTYRVNILGNIFLQTHCYKKSIQK